MIEQEETTYNRVEAAKYLGIADTSIYNLLNRKELPDRRAETGKLFFYEHELLAYQTRKEQAQARPEPVEAASTIPDAIREEVLLVSRALGILGNSVPGFKRVKAFQEVQPTMRVWDMEVETANGMEKWQVIFDRDDFRVKPVS